MPDAAEETQTDKTESRPASESAGTPVGGGKNVVLPTAALGKIKRDAVERGKREAMADLERQAKAAGFESLQSMFSVTAALAKNGGSTAESNGNGKKKQGQQQQRTNDAPRETEEEPQVRTEQRNQNGGNHRSWKEQQRWERQLERERKAREDERKVRLQEERRRKTAERRAEALEAEMALREEAIKAGVKDVDYAVELLKRNIVGKTEDDLKGFDEVKFFNDLREKQPYLFGEVAKPVTTGTGGKPAPSAPTPGDVTKKTAQEGQIDANKMNPEQYKEHLRKRGLDTGVF